MAKKKTYNVGPFRFSEKDVAPVKRAEKRKRLREQAKKYPTQPGVQKHLPKPKKPLTNQQQLTKAITGERRLSSPAERKKGYGLTRDAKREQEQLRRLAVLAKLRERNAWEFIKDQPGAALDDVKGGAKWAGYKMLEVAASGVKPAGHGPVNTAPLQAKSVKTAGLSDKDVKKFTKNAATIIDAAARPSYAISAATRAGVEGENILKGAEKGITGKDRKGFTPLVREGLRAVGVNDKSTVGNIVSNVVGLGADVALDPLTYISFGATSVPQAAGKQAARRAYKEAAKKGLKGAARERYVKTAVDIATSTAKAKHGTKKGLQVHFNLGIPGSSKQWSGQTTGKLTSKANRLSGDLPTQVRESAPIQALGRTFAADFRPKGVSPEDWKTGRDALRRARAGIEVASTTAGRRAKAAKRAGLEDPRYIYALEKADLSLPQTRAIKRELEKDFGIKQAAGLLDEPFSPGALTKQGFKDIKKTLGRDVRVMERKVTTAKRKAAKEQGRAHGTRVSLTRALQADRQQLRQSIRARKAAERSGNAASLQAAKETERANRLALREIEAKIRYAEKTNKGLKYLDQFGEVPARYGGTRMPNRKRLATAENEVVAGEQLLGAMKAASKNIGKSADDADNFAYLQRLREVFDEVGASRASARVGQYQDLQKLDALEYVPHVQNRNFEKSIRRKPEDVTELGISGSGGRITPMPEYGRSIPMSLEELGKRGALLDKDPYSFHTNPVNLLGRSGKVSKQGATLAAFWEDVLEGTGRRITKGEPIDLSDVEAVYKFDPKRPGKLVKVAEPGSAERLHQLSNNPGNHVILNRRMVAELTDQLRPGFVESRLPGTDQVVGAMKSLMTKYNIPGHHVINHIGDIMLGFQAGTPRLSPKINKAVYGTIPRATWARNRAESSAQRFLTDEGIATPEILQKPLKVGHIDNTVGEWIDEFEQFGINSHGYYGHEIPSQTKRGGPFTRFLAGRENINRQATYMSARGRGMTPDDAAAYTNKHHIDYSDLTKFEQSLRSLPLPFATFFLKNARIQLGQFFQRPGKMANVAKTLNAAARQSGYEDYMEFYDGLKDYEKGQLLIPVGKGKRVNVSLPQATGFDFASMDEDEIAQAIFNQLNPMFKIPVELKLNKRFFNNMPIKKEGSFGTGEPHGGLVPAPSWAAKLGLTTRYKDKKTGKMYDGWDAKTDYLVRSLPQSNQAVQYGLDDERRQGRSTLEQIFSQAGFKLSEPSASKANVFKQLNDVNTRINRLEATGKKGSAEHIRLKLKAKDLRKQIFKRKSTAAPQSGIPTTKGQSYGIPSAGAGGAGIPGMD